MAPRFIYDDECGFCTWCAAVAARHADVEPVGFSELTAEQKARLPEHWRACMHLMTDDDVFSCGKAAEQTTGRMGWLPRKLIRLVSRLPGYRTMREKIYHWAARHRDWWGAIVSRERV